MLALQGLAKTRLASLGPRSLLRSCRALSSLQQEDVADVAIVGGGMVGAALGALLASNPLTASMRIVLIDQKPQKSEWAPKPYPELRVSTVTPASIRAMKKAGAWAAVEGHSAAVTDMQVWDASGSGCIRWHARDAGLENMAFVAENSLMQASLIAAMQRPPSHAASEALAPAPEPHSTSDGPHPSSSAASHKQPGQEGSSVQCLWPATIKDLRLPPYSLRSPVPWQPASMPRPDGGGHAAEGSEEGRASRSSDGSSGGGSCGGELAKIVFEDNSELRARLVVAADGAGSRIRQLAGFRTFGWKYRQRAVVATVELQEGPTSTAWQRFLPTGPLAVLPVRDGLANIVWSTTPEAARALEQLSPAAFAAAANKALQDSLPDASRFYSSSLGWLSSLQQASASLSHSSMSPLQASLPEDSQFQAPPLVQCWVGDAPKSFPLQMQHSGRYVRTRLALIGDAAHAVHPLAGQGVNLGFGDAEALADTLAFGRSCGGDPGDILTLQEKYEKPRQAANLAMTTALDGLARAFSIQVQPFAAARNFGLNLLNRTTPLRTAVMRIAMGL